METFQGDMTGPFLFLSANVLAERGLLPWVRRSAPRVQRADEAVAHLQRARPIWQAAARTTELRRKHWTLRKIAERLDTEGLGRRGEGDGLRVQSRSTEARDDRR